MATQSVPQSAEKKPRFTEDDYETVLSKLSQIFASIEAQWHILATDSDPYMRGRHIDTIQTLAQVGGFIADHAGSDCGYYGDAFRWLEIPEGEKLEVKSDAQELRDAIKQATKAEVRLQELLDCAPIVPDEDKPEGAS